MRGTHLADLVNKSGDSTQKHSHNALFMQHELSPAVHMAPHAPQLLLSDLMSTQVPLAHMISLGETHWHLPALQIWPAPKTRAEHRHMWLRFHAA
jgi:hypothetical protein